MPRQNTLKNLSRQARHAIRRLFFRPESSIIDTREDPSQHVDVLFINGCDLETLRRYRVLHQREELETYGVTTDEVHYTAVTATDAKRARTFIIYRCPITDGVRDFIDSAHGQGKRVFFDVDDLVIDTSYTNELSVVKAMSEDEKAVFDDGVMRAGATLTLCDAAITTTECLAEELRHVIPKVFVNRNVASKEMVALSEAALSSYEPANDDTVTIGYFSGSMTHNADFLEVLPALVRVFETHPNVRFKTVGELRLPEELQPFAGRIESSPYVAWQELPKLSRSVDINIAPLEGTLFNEAKSENKWTEAALVNVPTVASKLGAFNHSVRDGETGFLCKTTDEWFRAVSSLVVDPELRRRIGSQAHNDCLLNRTTIGCGWRLVSILSESGNHPRSIERLTPRAPKDQVVLVNAFLASRDLPAPTSTLDLEPWAKVTLEQRLSSAKRIVSDGKRLLVSVYERNCGDAPTFRYFGYNVSQQLGHSQVWGGVYIFVDELSQPQCRNILNHANAITLVRCRIRPELVTLARHAKQADKPLAYVIDDNVLGASCAPHVINLMANEPTSQFERDFWTGTAIRFELASRLADCVFVPNRFFAELLEGRSGMPCFVTHSFLNEEQLRLSDEIASIQIATASARPFTIGYFSGTSSHQEDFALVRPALLKFLKNHRETRLLIGGEFKLDDELYGLLETGKLKLVPKVDYATLQYLQASVDVVLAPLVENDFSNCKSALKVYEAGVVCTPACASATESYREAIEDKRTGFLCSSEEDWISALETLMANPQQLHAMGSAARAYALEHFSGSVITAELEHALNKLMQSPRRPIPLEVELAVTDKHDLDWDNPFEASPAFAGNKSI